MTALLAIAALVAATGTRSAEGAQPRVPVFFLQGEQLAHVTRPATTPLDAVQQLIAGPTRAELARGFRTYIPTGTRVLSVTRAGSDLVREATSRIVAAENAVLPLTPGEQAILAELLHKVACARANRAAADE